MEVNQDRAQQGLPPIYWWESNNVPNNRDIIHLDDPPPPLSEPTTDQQTSDDFTVMSNFPNFPSFFLPRENPHSEEKGTHTDMTSYLVPIPSR